MENLIEERKRLVQSRIEKSFNDGLNLNEEINIEKASHGVYADNAENRRKNRVGQEYGHAAQQKELTGKPTGGSEQPTVEDHAGKASDKALQRAAADKNAEPEVREAAKKELEKRGGDDKQSMYNDYGELDMNHPSVKRKFELMDKLYGGDKLSNDEKKELDGLHKRSEEDKMSKMSPEKKAEYQKGMADLKKRMEEEQAKAKKEKAAKESKSSGRDDDGKKDNTSDIIIGEVGYANDDNPIVKRHNELRTKLKNNGKWDGLNEEENKEYHKLGKVIQNAYIQWKKNKEEKKKQRMREETQSQGNGKLDFTKLGNEGNIATFKFERGYKSDGEDHIFRIMNYYGKKDMKQDIDTLNDKLGTNLKLEDFKKRGGEWYGNRFEVFFNTETGEVDSNVRKEWKKDKPFKEYNKYSVEELLGGYYTYINGEGDYDYKEIKRDLKESVKKNGVLKVAKSFVKNAIGAETLDGNSVQNEDEAKCEISGIFKEWGIKTDDETKKFLEYNPDNVWWL